MYWDQKKKKNPSVSFFLFLSSNPTYRSHNCRALPFCDGISLTTALQCNTQPLLILLHKCHAMPPPLPTPCAVQSSSLSNCCFDVSFVNQNKENIRRGGRQKKQQSASSGGASVAQPTDCYVDTHTHSTHCARLDRGTSARQARTHRQL